MNAQTGLSNRLARWAQKKPSEESPQVTEAPAGGAASQREATRNGSTREIERRRALYDEIGAFLFANDLDLTPVNFGLAHDFLTGNDFQIEQAVRAILNSGGTITNALADKIVAERHAKEVSQDNIGQMLESVEKGLSRFVDLAKESTSSATDYSNALQEHVEGMSDSEAAGPLVATLIGLTRTMVDKTRSIEGEMRESQKKTQVLQQSLEAARRAADQDHLTGLPNRRAFEARLKEELAAAQASGEGLCVAICDIDHFKYVNDNHGHDTGDRVLKFVGSLLRKASSERCHVARHGGEEFVMLFRGKALSEACDAVDAVRQDLASRNLVDRNTGERMEQISFSGGVADVLAYEDPRVALKAADRALYLAKEHGRNRIYMATDT